MEGFRAASCCEQRTYPDLCGPSATPAPGSANTPRFPRETSRSGAERVARDRRHRDQPLAAGTAHQMQEKRFDTVFSVVRQSDPGEAMFPDESLEEASSSLAAGSFDISCRLANRRRMSEAGNTELCGQVLDEAFIFVRVRSAKTMVQMGDRKVVPEFPQNQEEGRGICSTGNADQDAVPRCEHLMPGNGFTNLADEGNHGLIIACGKCRRTDSNRRPKDYETFALTT